MDMDPSSTNPACKTSLSGLSGYLPCYPRFSLVVMCIINNHYVLLFLGLKRRIRSQGSENVHPNIDKNSIGSEVADRPLSTGISLFKSVWINIFVCCSII